jgi:DUF4097 and DUF4098 domain-containing protein YvlB
MTLRSPGLRLAFLPALAVGAALLSACGVHFGTGVEARDTWSRTYTVTAGATLDVRNTNGKISIVAGDGDQVRVEATRVARGATEEAAKAALAGIAITERATADRIELDASQPGLQIALGQSKTVNFEVTLPRTTHVTIKATNGDIELEGVDGTVRVDGTNGRIRARGSAQGVDLTTVNGLIALDLTSVGKDGVRCRTTNGEITVTMPADSKATLAARVTNGQVRTSGLTLAATAESRRRLDATVGGGGPEIRLEATNGAIQVSGR